jgi:hypothetical protein
MTENIVPSRIEQITERIRHYLRVSKGWRTRIMRESGCSIYTIHRMASEDDYFPRTDELAKIERWFVENGIHYTGPQGKTEEQIRFQRAQMELMSDALFGAL